MKSLDNEQLPAPSRLDQRDKFRRTAVAIVVVAGLVVASAALTGCSTPPGLEPAPPGEEKRAAQGNYVTTGQLSGRTVRILEVEGLTPEPSVETAARLREVVGARPNGDRLVALAEVSHAVANQFRHDREFAWEQMMVATCASWAAMFREGMMLSSYGPQWLSAQTLHNASLGRVIAGLPELAGCAEAHLDRGLLGQSIALDYTWRVSKWSPAPFERFLPADDFRVLGMRNRNRQFGVGAALLAERVVGDAADVPIREQNLPSDYQTVALSGVVSNITYSSDAAWLPTAMSLEIHDPSTTPTTIIAGRSIPLEADFTGALTHTIARDRPLRRAGLGGLRDVDRWESQRGVYMLEPFDPERIPVVFIHGLVSSPFVWREMINDLWADPLIRRRFQFWFVLFPTGNPFGLSAANVRSEFEQLRDLHDPERTIPAFRQMVLVGHSMGGLVSRRLVSYPGEALWATFSDVPFEDVQVLPEDREVLERVFFNGPMPGVTRVVFIATPHRGSVIADWTIGRFASRLVRLPPTLLESAGRVFEANPDGIRRSLDGRVRVATGIDSLSPNSAFLKAQADLPFPEGVTAHSIIGRRSGGDGPGGSDGVVPYSSAHVPGVASELIIGDSDHGVPARPAATREMYRILMEHLRAVDAAQAAPVVPSQSAPPSTTSSARSAAPATGQ